MFSTAVYKNSHAQYPDAAAAAADVPAGATRDNGAQR